jgi:hypothetical protein
LVVSFLLAGLVALHQSDRAVAAGEPSCSGACRVLEPVADTYLEGGKETSRDHGACPELEVDQSPEAITYLKFDLSALRDTPTSATLKLRCLDSSADGGTLYPVLDSSWIEGDRCGRSGAGLRRTDVDCNRDAKIDERDRTCTAYVPDFSQPLARIGRVSAGRDVVVDVTAGFRSGVGFYTLALRNDRSNGATYASREHPKARWRPRLEVVELLNDECDTPTVIEGTPFADTIDTRDAGTSDGDPNQSCVFPTGLPNSVWYSFTASTDGIVSVDTAGSDYATVVSVHTGACNPIDHRLTEVACEDGGGQSTLTFTVSTGTTYLILVTDGTGGFSPGGGTLRFALDFANF